MSATDELRRMLDEAGVEWEGTDFTEPTRGHPAVTNIDVECDAMFVEYVDGPVLKLFCLTPEQAIAATVGRGTCEADETETIKCWVKCKDEPSTERMELIHVMECSECGHTYEHVNGDYEFCPRCGKKRVDA